MDGVVIVGGLVLLVLFGPWVLVWRVNVRRKREREEDQGVRRELASRISALEHTVQKLEAQRPAPMEQEAALAYERPIAASRAPTPSSPSVVVVPPPPPPVVEPAASVQAAETWVRQGAAESATTKYSSSTDRAVPSARIPVTPHPSPTFRTKEPGPSLADRLKSSLDIEEMLGTNWLNKAGIAFVVLGIAFFLALELKTLGPAGKVLVGFVTAGAMLGAGIWFDRKERYRILARAGIGGGWAMLFFTTYAMYHVPAARVLSSQAVDLVLMLAVAAAMVAHTLRYRSQVVTGLAFLLAFLTVTISHSNVYSLSAGAVLAAGLVVIVGRMRWFELEVFGILASYLNHYLWLRPIIEPMQGKRHPFPEFAASAGILALYWLIFRVSYVFRRPGESRQERISTVAALLNTTLLLVLFKYQSTHPEWAFWALLAIGAIETLLGQLPATRRRRSAVIVLSTLGVVLLIAAFPFRYSGMRLSVLWLVEAEALLLIGVWTKEVVFRRLGMLAALLVSGQMIAVDAARICGRRMDDADLRPDFGLAIVFVVAAVVFYANAHWVLRRWPDLFAKEFDRRVMQRLSYVAAVMLLIAAWAAFPESWTAVAWCAVGLALALARRRLAVREPGLAEHGLPGLTYQANFLALASVLRVLVINLEATDKFHGLSLRLLTVTLVSALLYVTSRWIGDPNRGGGISIGKRLVSSGQMAGAAYTWSASGLLTLLAWYELLPVGVADAWLVGGLILFEIGLSRKKLSLRLQGYAAFIASFLRIFFVNLNAAGNPGEISPRFYTVVPLALGFFYAYWRLYESSQDLVEAERRFKAADICCWLGTISFAVLMRFELEADWVAAAWAALVLALLAIAWRSERRVFLYQGLFVAAGVSFRTVFHNFYERSYFPASGWESRWITAGTAVALLLAALPFAFQLRKKDEESAETGLVRLLQRVVRRPEQLLFFFAVGLLTALLAIEMRHGMVTLAWGVEGVAVFVVALWLAERSFRLTGLGLLLLCAGKILLVDVWRLDPRDRYLTLIVLGAALLLVSFLYTRNREALRQYL
ncbi:MAG TPA: DUF2339 domain-containing protein [Candidatus Acidoferrum sp.]|jgi:uncharacterized membrane protein|nr:DUF2339 domain-containing protein [Candidatus Acidoferrum sp.]